jgi:hypothetical protein
MPLPLGQRLRLVKRNFRFRFGIPGRLRRPGILAFAAPGAALPTLKSEATGISPTSNDRQNGKKTPMRHDIDRFPPKSSCRLSYQACVIRRILWPSGMPVCGDRRLVNCFDPAETT